MLPYFCHRIPVLRDSSVQTDSTERMNILSTSNECTAAQEPNLFYGSRKHEAKNNGNKVIQHESTTSRIIENKNLNGIKSKNSLGNLETNRLKDENVLSKFNAHVEVMKIEDNIKLSFTVSQSSISSIFSLLKSEEREISKQNGALSKTLLERNSIPQLSSDGDASNEDTDAALHITECDEGGFGDSTDSWSTISDEILKENENSSFHLELDKVQEENDSNSEVKALEADRGKKDEENEAACENIIGCNSAEQVSDTNKSSEDVDVYQLKLEVKELGLQDSMKSKSLDSDKNFEEIKSGDVLSDINLAPNRDEKNTSTGEADLFKERISNDSFGTNCENAPASSNTPTSETIIHTDCKENILDIASDNGRKIVESSLSINSTMNELDNFRSVNSSLPNDHSELNFLDMIQSSSTTYIAADLKESIIQANAENHLELICKEANADGQSKQTKTSIGSKQDIISEKQVNCEQTLPEKNSLDVELEQEMSSSCNREVSCTYASDIQGSNSFSANDGDERLEMNNEIDSSISLSIDSEKETIADEISISTSSEENAALVKPGDLSTVTIGGQKNGLLQDEDSNPEMAIKKDDEQLQCRENIVSKKEDNEILSSTLENIENSVENSKLFLNISLNSQYELDNSNEMNESCLNVKSRSESSFKASSLSNNTQIIKDKIYSLEEFALSSETTDLEAKSSNNAEMNRVIEVDLGQMKETMLIPVDEESSDDSFIINQLSEKVKTPPEKPVAQVELNNDSFTVNNYSLHERAKSIVGKSTIVIDEEWNNDTINKSMSELDETTSGDASTLVKSSFNMNKTIENVEGSLLEDPNLCSSMILRESNEMRQTNNTVHKTIEHPNENLSEELKVCSSITQESNEMRQTNKNGDKELEFFPENTKKNINNIKFKKVSNKSTETEKISSCDISTVNVVDHLQGNKSSEIKMTVEDNRTSHSNMNEHLVTKLHSEKDSSNFMKEINKIDASNPLQSDDSGVEEAGMDDKDVTPKVLKGHNTFCKSKESLSSSNLLSLKVSTSELSNQENVPQSNENKKTELKSFISENNLDSFRSNDTFQTSESISESEIRESKLLANDADKNLKSGNHFKNEGENNDCKPSVKELNSSLHVLTEGQMSIFASKSENINDTASLADDLSNDNDVKLALNEISKTRSAKIISNSAKQIDLQDVITEENDDDLKDDYHETEKNSTFTVTPEKEPDVMLNSKLLPNKNLETTSVKSKKIGIQNSVDEIDVAPTRQRPKLFRQIERTENITEETEDEADLVQKGGKKSDFKQSDKMSLHKGSLVKTSTRCKSEEPELKSKTVKPIEQRRRSAEPSSSERTSTALKMGTRSKNLSVENGNSAKNASKGTKIREITKASFVEDISAQTKRSTRKLESKSSEKSNENSTPARIIRVKNIQSIEKKGLDTASILNTPEKKQRSKNVKLDIESKESENEMSEASNPDDNSTPRKNQSRTRAPARKNLTLSTEKGSLSNASGRNTPKKRLKPQTEEFSSENELSEASNPDVKKTPVKTKSRQRAAVEKNASLSENFSTPERSTRSKTTDLESVESVHDDSLRKTRRTRVTKN